MAIVRSIDVGYGNTKYVLGPEGKGFACDHFPSVAAVKGHRDIGSGVVSRKDVVQVVADGGEFLVGRDADLVLGARQSGRVLHRDYPETAAYLALARGALAYMKQPMIDLLVTGLPVDYHAAYKERLTERLAGRHEYPDGSVVTVAQAWVIPQPIGGFIDYAIGHHCYQDLKETLCLVVDVGYFTLDWVVCRGLKVLDERSGSVPGGVSLWLDKLAQAVSEELQEPFRDLGRLDQAVRRGGRLDWYGRPYTFTHLLPKAAAAIEEALQALRNGVGAFDDIGRVIVVGGGAAHYGDALRAVCRRNPLVVVEDGIYANVRGFAIAGEERVAKHG